MSSQMLKIKPEEIDTAEKRGKYTVSIIGCGQIGVLHACLFAEAGFKVKCVDANQTVVNSISRGKIPTLKREIESQLRNYLRTGFLSATTEARKAFSESDIIIITTPVKIGEKKKVNYSDIESTCKLVGSSLRHGSLIITMSIFGVGTTQKLIKETLENTSGLRVGTDFGLAYSSSEARNEHTSETPANQERILAATDRNSLNAAAIILGIVSKGEMKRTMDVEMAEAVALFDVIQKDVGVALSNELAHFCEKMGIDYLEAQKLANHRIYSTTPLSMLMNAKDREEAYLLLEDSEDLNLKLRIPTIAREVNEEIVKHAIDLIKDALKNCGKTLRRARVSLLGISQVPNARSPPKKMVQELVRMLETKGVRTGFYEPYFPVDEIAETHCHPSKNITEALEGADCIVIVTGHDQFKRLDLKTLKVLMKKPAAIVDLEGIIEPNDVEREGFIYRGLGRGIWTK